MSIATSMPHYENGIGVNFPNTEYFQFENCVAYVGIKGSGVKEMDFGWWDASRNTLYLVELKGYYNPSNPLHKSVDLSDQYEFEKRLKELYDKSVHSLEMLHSSRIPVVACLPSGYTTIADLQLLHILSVPPGHESYLAFMKDKLKTMLKPQRAIFRVSGVSVISYDMAKSLLNWVV